ncbi:uncharacterized protein LOC116287563 [Actinia tenebrosa]|uniref:Uncharacterized protein LOC116287563 n=1 Tax=Actinia tenebrosa TaxID=6105 RepID=A0A6P8HBP4_ACTTE|nr:uncharacterized protein LOC116287563 [Actinia tenebrosa]
MMNSWALLNLLLCVSVFAEIAAFSLTRLTRINNPRHIPTEGDDFVPVSPSSSDQALSSKEQQLPALRNLFISSVPRVSTLFGSSPLPEEEKAPEPESTQEPIPESEGTKGPKSEAEPNGTSESEPEPEAETWPEPGPLWSEAFKTWKSAWSIHIYLSATAYLLMAFYAAYYVVFNVYDGLDKKYLSVSLNIMVLVFCLSRSFIMYLDPYHQGDIIHALKVMHLLWSIGGPCLTAADSLIILALLEMCHLRITIPSLQRASVISVIVTLHFFFVIVTDFVVAEYVSAKGMILFCQIFYLIWGFVLGTGYMRLGYVLDRQLFGHKPKKDKQDKLYIFLIYASGIANYGLVLIMLYTAVGVFGVYSNVKFVDAWHWYILQSLSRFSEVITCVLIFTVSAKRTRVKQAMDDISAIESRQGSEIPTTRESATPKQQWKRKVGLLQAKKVVVQPFESTEDMMSTNLMPGARRERRVSMFTDMESTNRIVMKMKSAKAERDLTLARAKEADQMKSIFSWNNGLISTFEQSDLEVDAPASKGENMENGYNLNELQISTDEKDSDLRPNLQSSFNGFFKDPRKRSRSHTNEAYRDRNVPKIDEEPEDKASKRSAVRKISAQVLRRLSQPFKTGHHKGDNDVVVLQDELQGSHTHDNAGFQRDERELQDMPNVPI